MARQQFAGSTSGQTMTVREMLERHLEEVSVTKASNKADLSRSLHLYPALGDYRLHTLTSKAEASPLLLPIGGAEIRT
jgi:hypothetical protein